VQEPEGSKSIKRVFFSATAKLAARFTAVVVFPTPPLGTVTDIIFLIYLILPFPQKQFSYFKLNQRY
jgi:hypothetical protein